MRLFSAVTAAVALLSTVVLAAPSVGLKPILEFNGPTHPNSYIVKLKNDVVKDNHLAWLDTNHKSTSNVTYRNWQSRVFHGYAGTFDTDALDALRASSDVEYIEEDGIFQLEATVTQNNAVWGLQRISQNARLASQDPLATTYTYRYDSTAGTGVDIYVIDTGIYIDHTDFGGRATWGATFGGYASQDGEGHGTHVAGIAGSTTYGVAKRSRLIAVKTFSDAGTGRSSDIIAGMNYVATSAIASLRPSIANMSLGGPASVAVDAAAAALVATGVHTVAAAGNSNVDASTRSPAREPTVITVGASNITDARAAFSNWGAVVDIFAPGQDVISLGIANPTALHTDSGSSMATAYVSGMIANLISHNGNLLPENMATRLVQLSLKNILTNIPAGTVNRLARNEIA